MSADALITAIEVRKLLGRGRSFALASLAGFPECVHRARGPYPDRYRVEDVARYQAGHRFDDAQPSVGRRTIPASCRGIGLPSEREMTLSLRRDLFGEQPLTAAPGPCLHWSGFLAKAGHKLDGLDVSPATLRAEAERDRAREARPGRMPGSVGHRPEVARPRASNLRLSNLTPEPARRGHKTQPVTLARSVDEVLQVGA